jgi:phosphoenolpyruvate carboxylase
MTPFVRARAAEMGVPLYHQSSFQGGDGYRLFGTPALAQATISGIFAAEMAPASPAWLADPFYQQTDFSLDLFLSLKNWHETLFADASYSDLLDVFSNNLLPKTGSRPTKRVVQAGNERRDPSKMRAIPHNAILQQLGFLANVISGMGSAAYINSEQFLEIYQDSPRLQQCLGHVRTAKSLGSLNTVLAYCRMIDAGFWVNRAYHGKQYKNQRAFRKLGQHLQNDTQATGIRHTVWRLRDDLVDLYRLVDRIGDGSIRITGDDRSTLDLLHAIRIAVIIDSLTLICQTPNLGESNQYSNADILALGLRLDFETAMEIIQSAFTAGYAASAKDGLAEAEDYSQSNTGNYSVIDEQILQPLAANQRIIRTITQMISAHYGAHG